MTATVDAPRLGDIDVTSLDFWTAPSGWRDRAFDVLRSEAPFASFEEPDIPGIPRGPGYHALTRYADIEHVSRGPKDFCSGRGSTTVLDMPPDFAELFGSMIVWTRATHASAASSRAGSPRAHWNGCWTASRA